MQKKIHWIMINVVTFILIALMLFVPLLNVKEINGDLINKDLFGFNILSGFSIKNINDSGEIKNDIRVMSSSLTSFVPIMLLISTFIINKVVKGQISKDIINFLGIGICFVYVVLLPIICINFEAENYVKHLDFTKLWGYYLSCVIFGLAFIYYFVLAIIELVQVYKNQKASITPTSEKQEEDKASLNQ